MPSISEIRQQYPQYSDMSDSDLADALHRKFYSDMPREEFNSKIGYEVKPRPSGRHLSFEEGAAMLDREERMAGPSGTFGAATTSFLDGMPIVGPMLLGTAERGAAALSTAFNDKSYGENLKEAQALTETAQQQNPYVSTGAGVTGAVAGTIPMVMAAPAAFGAGSAPLWMRGAASMASGAGIGGTDAAVRSEGDPNAVWDGTMLGGGLGLAGPIVGKAAGSVVRKVMDTYRTAQAAKGAGTRLSTVNKLSRMIAGDGLDEAAMRTRLDELGPEAMIMDLGPNAQSRAAAIAARPGRGQEIVRSAVNARQGGANARIGNAVDEAMGRNVVPSSIDDAIQAGKRDTGQLYGDAFQNARAVDTRPIAEGLESQIVNLRGGAQKSMQQVRGMLNIHGADVLDPNPGTLFQTRQAIDGMLQTEADTKVIAALTNVRQQIDDTLAGAVPRLKEIDASFAELARQRSALTQGQAVLDHGRTAPRPPELAVMVEEGAVPQGMQIGPSAVPLRLSQGARAEVDRILGSNANDIARLNSLIKSEGDWNRARLATLFGQEKADGLFRVLGNELQFAQTRDVVTRNSETARRMLANQEIEGGGQGLGLQDAYVVGGSPAAARAGAKKLVDKLAEKILGTLSRRVEQVIG